MKCRLSIASSSRKRSGIALIISLVMLALVTVMAIVFLAVTRTERSSVKVLEDTATATYMAEAALERAKAEAIANMAMGGSKLHYDLFNSRAFQNEGGYRPQAATAQPDPRNVPRVDKWGVQGRDTYLRILANLQHDPIAPVFVETNETTRAGDFRFYVDFNRNRRFETNGFLPVMNSNNVPVLVPGPAPGSLVTNYDRFVGDPEWIGVLERPDLPHSETNRFVGRMAYLALPAGKSLDLNFIHNQADERNGDDQIDRFNARSGFTRNEGVGSWEINLAAFLRELNPNNLSWHPASYQFRIGQNTPPQGDSFSDARAMLAFRYDGRRSNLKAPSFTLGQANLENPANGLNFLPNNVDDFGDGPFVPPGARIFDRPVAPDNDDPDRLGWPGSLNTNAFTDIQQLFSLQNYSPGFTNRLQRAMNVGNSSEDRYTLYRLASQLGADSVPALEGRIHLNYQNAVGRVTNNITVWTNAVEFFTNAAQLMLQASIDRTVAVRNSNGTTNQFYEIAGMRVRTNFSINNIQIYVPPPTNNPFATQSEYGPVIHRILQVAANLFDNGTNKGREYPYYPTVFRPLFFRTPTNIIIYGWAELTNSNALNLPWRDIAGVYQTNSGGSLSNINLYGQHLVLGAKKGHPNFNELALQSYVEVSRKLELLKANTRVTDTNQLFVVSMEHRWGIEAWNSYTNIYRRNLSVGGDVLSRVVVRDGTNLNFAPVFDRTFLAANITNIGNWPGRTGFTNFSIVYDNTFSLLTNSAYSGSGTGRGVFGLPNVARFTDLEPAPRFSIFTTNKVRFWMLDRDSGRIVDFVSFDNLVTVMDLSTNLYSIPSQATAQVGGTGGVNDNMFWDPTPVAPGSVLTRGLTNQLAASAGDIPLRDSEWRRYRFNSPDREGAIAVFRRFSGLPLRSVDPEPGPVTDLRHQAPFVPTRHMHQLISWQVDDPLVHYMVQDLTRRPGSDKPANLPVGNRPPLPWNIGMLNEMYSPWAGNPAQQDPKTDFNIGLKDPGVRSSDDWEFPIAQPTNSVHPGSYFYPNIGAVGQVHRGTPWQTLYLKSVTETVVENGRSNRVFLIQPNDWYLRRGTMGTYPSQDWKFLEVFTTAENENAARGLLSVNQTNRAAWSAVLSGVIVPSNVVRRSTLQGLGIHERVAPKEAYEARALQPATPLIDDIVHSINSSRTNQLELVPNPNPAARPQLVWDAVFRTNQFGQRVAEFGRMGEVLSAPGLSLDLPWLDGHPKQRMHVWTDRAVEYLPQQILSLLQRDEPRFVVYAFGQALKPAPRSLTSHPDYYHMCTNYQIAGEVITKTTFRIEGDPASAANPATPMRAVVESYQVLPPAE